MGVTERMVRHLCEQGVIGLAVGRNQRKTYVVWKEMVEEVTGRKIVRCQGRSRS